MMRGSESIEGESDIVAEVQKRFGVDVRDDRAVLGKLNELQGKMPDVAELSNLWSEYQEQQKNDQMEIKKAA